MGAIASLTEPFSVRSSNHLLRAFASVASTALRAQIGGVFLLAPGGEELSIQSCVGNRTAETARLRMRPGQGLAGLAFEVDQAVKVDRYLEATEITPDFRPLARKERVRAALASPLRDVGGRTVGVLEVWRRGLARFTRTDLDLIDALAELTGEILAYLDAFETTVRFASDLEAQIDEVRRRISDSDSAEQAESQLLATALDADDIDALARGLARATDGVAAIVDDAGTVMAASRPLSRAERALVSRAPSVLGSDPAVLAPGVLGCRVCVATTAATIVLLQHKVREDHGLRLVGWGGLASALTLARVRLDRAMSGTRDDLLWEVTGDSGPTAAHLAAKLDLAGTRRVLLVRGPEAALAAVRHRLDEILGQPMSTIRNGTLLAIPSAQRATPAAISELLETRALPSGETLAAGLSSPRAPDRLRRARHEAEIALRVARSLGVRTAAYDGLGLLRLLLPVSEEDSPAAFAEELLGPVLEYDRRRSGELLKTLRMYLESDCVIAEAAGRLFVHPKTLRYRLSKVEALTGLDLASQRGRFDAQLALAILQAHSVARSQND